VVAPYFVKNVFDQRKKLLFNLPNPIQKYGFTNPSKYFANCLLDAEHCGKVVAPIKSEKTVPTNGRMRLFAASPKD